MVPDRIRKTIARCRSRQSGSSRNEETRSAVWDDERALWRLTSSSGRTHEARALVAALGQLNRPLLPDIEGRESFAGPAFHSARWDHGVDLAGKRVAVVGSAASAVQIIPEVAKEAKQPLRLAETLDRLGRRSQAKDEDVYRLAVEGVEPNGRPANRQDGQRPVRRRVFRVRDRDAAADAGRAQLLPPQEGVQDVGKALTRKLPGLGQQGE